MSKDTQKKAPENTTRKDSTAKAAKTPTKSIQEENIKVVLAMDDPEETMQMEAMLEESKGIELSAKAGDGEELLRMIDMIHPDVVIMELFMSRMDGLSVLEQYQAVPEGEKPNFIVLSEVKNEKITEAVFKAGASYYMLKPVNPQIMANRVRVFGKISYGRKIIYPIMINRVSEAPAMYGVRTLEGRVTQLIHAVGIPAHLRGYQYIRDAVLMTIRHMELVNSVTKDIYPLIAAKYETTPSRVERAIRHAIEVCWKNSPTELVLHLNNAGISEDKGKPTNSQLIATLADKVRMEVQENQ